MAISSSDGQKLLHRDGDAKGRWRRVAGPNGYPILPWPVSYFDSFLWDPSTGQVIELPYDLTSSASGGEGTATEPAAEPAAEPAPEPVPEPAAKPVPEPAAEPRTVASPRNFF